MQTLILLKTCHFFVCMKTLIGLSDNTNVDKLHSRKKRKYLVCIPWIFSRKKKATVGIQRSAYREKVENISSKHGVVKMWRRLEICSEDKLHGHFLPWHFPIVWFPSVSVPLLGKYKRSNGGVKHLGRILPIQTKSMMVYPCVKKFTLKVSDILVVDFCKCWSSLL